MTAAQQRSFELTDVQTRAGHRALARQASGRGALLDGHYFTWTALALIPVLSAIMWWVPVLLVRADISKIGGSPPAQIDLEKRVNLVNEYRRTVSQVVGGFVVLVGGGLAWAFKTQQRSDQRDKTFTERFEAAIDLLRKSRDLWLRVGAIHALRRLAEDSGSDIDAIIRVLATFVKVQSKQYEVACRDQSFEDPSDPTDGPQRPGADLCEAFVVLASLAERRGRRLPGDIDLRGVCLAGMQLPNGVCLRGFDLRGARLSRIEADGLEIVGGAADGAMLDEATLPNAHFHGVSFERASFVSAKLTGARFDGARFNGTIVRGVTLGDTTADGEPVVRNEHLPDEKLLIGLTRRTGNEVFKRDEDDSAAEPPPRRPPGAGPAAPAEA